MIWDIISHAMLMFAKVSVACLIICMYISMQPFRGMCDPITLYTLLVTKTNNMKLDLIADTWNGYLLF